MKEGRRDERGERVKRNGAEERGDSWIVRRARVQQAISDRFILAGLQVFACVLRGLVNAGFLFL